MCIVGEKVNGITNSIIKPYHQTLSTNGSLNYEPSGEGFNACVSSSCNHYCNSISLSFCYKMWRRGSEGKISKLIMWRSRGYRVFLYL